MVKKNKRQKKGKGAEKTLRKTNKKFIAAQKKNIEKLGETDILNCIKQLEEQQAQLKEVVEKVCTPPSPRSSFSLVAHPDKEELILFGGELFNGQCNTVYNDLFFYNIFKREWRQVYSPSGPTPRCGHQMVSIAIGGGQLWLFGGEYASPSQSQFYHYKDLWMLSLKTKLWEKVNSPNGPSARSGHRMGYTKKRIVIFGGFYDNYHNSHYYNDVHMFSLENYQWIKIVVEGISTPSPRSGCCIATTSDAKLIVWGGYSKKQNKKGAETGVAHADMFCLVPNKIDRNKFEWNKIRLKGYKPPPRSSVGFTCAANDLAYCFGGVMDIEEDEEILNGEFGDELFSFDLKSLTCHLVDLKNNEMKVFPQSTVSKIIQKSKKSTPNNDINTVSQKSNTSEIEKPKSLNKFKPSPRMKPGLCVCKSILYLFGGIYEVDDKQYTYNDFYALDLHKLDEWSVLIPNDVSAHEWISTDDSVSESENTDETLSESEKSELEMDTN